MKRHKSIGPNVKEWELKFWTPGAFHDRSTTPDALMSSILIKFGERGYLACQKHWSQS